MIFLACLLTVVVETAFFAAFGYRDRYALTVIVCANIVTNLRSSLKRSITQDPYAVELYRAYATTDPTSAYYSYITYLDYYNFLVSAEQLAQEDPETLTANLNYIQNCLKNSYNAVSGYVGQQQGGARMDTAFFRGFV